MSYDKYHDDALPSRGQVEAGIQGYTAEEQSLLLWLHGWAMDALHGRQSLLLEAIGPVSTSRPKEGEPTKQLLDPTTLARIWQGKYASGIESFIAHVRRLKDQHDATAGTEWIETCVTRAIQETCDLVHRKRCMGMVVGESGRGKTHAFQHWCILNNHGKALYVYCHDSSGKRPLMMAIARRLGIRDTSRTTEELIDRIHGQLRPDMTLVLDEAHYLLTETSTSAPGLSALRTLHDTCKVAVILGVTPQFETWFRSDRLAKYLAQFKRRMKPGCKLAIPNRISTLEATQVARAFAAEPEQALIDVIKEEANRADSGSIAHILELLREARRTALAAGRQDVTAVDLAKSVAGERIDEKKGLPED